jgi:hypothetical protein
VLVSKVRCVDKGDNEFECIATVGGSDGQGQLEYVDIPVTASCDEENCTWRTG